MSFERLIRLAQKTGHTLIVHDPIQGRDVVLVSVDEYEELLSGREREKELQEAVRQSLVPTWQEQVFVPDVPPPPPMPPVVDPDTDIPPLREYEFSSHEEEKDDTSLLEGDEEDLGDLFEEEKEKTEKTTIERSVSAEAAPGWNSLGAIARQRFQSGAWMRGERERLADEVFAPKQTEKKSDEEGEEPIFYEEPVG